jgi:hypothetical protein
MSIAKYKVVSSSTIIELEFGVARAIEAGFQPYGSLVVTPDGLLMQPVVYYPVEYDGPW